MSPSLQTMGFFMSDINFCNTKEQLNHLGEVVTGKVNGSPTGADIDTSTLPYTGQVRKTLPALEEEYQADIDNFVQVSDQVIVDKSSEFDASIANKEAEADSAIDAYRLLSKGPYAAGILLEDKFQYITYNGESYFAVNPPYTTTATTPDADGNLFAGGYLPSHQLSLYTDIVYKSSGGNSAIENMLEELNLNPLMYAIGTYIKTGGTTFQYLDSTGPITLGNFRAFSCANIFDFTSTARSDSEAAIAAVATGLCVYIPNREQPWNLEFVTLNEGQKIKGDKTKVSISGNVTAFIHAKDSQVDGFVITGDGANSGSVNQAGVYGNNVGGTKTTNVDFRGIGGSAYQIDNIVQFHQGNELSSYTVDECNIGVNINTSAEYQNIGVGSITRCNTNLRIKGGNCNAFGLVISDAVDIGVDIVAGANDAHGQLNGALINHNSGSRSIRVSDTANGFLFNGCQLFNGAPIELKNCRNVWFRNCVKQAVAVIEDGCVKCGFANSDLLDGANTTPNVNNPSEVFWLDNNLPDSVAPNGPGSINGGYLNITQQVNATSPIGASDFDWDTVSTNAITNNLNYTVQQFYGEGGAGTGNPFIRGDEKRVRGGFQLQVSSLITIGKPGTPSWTADECRVLLRDASGGIVGFYTPMTQASIGGSNTITYQYSGNQIRGAFKVEVVNSSAVPLTIYRDQLGTDIRTTMSVTGW